MKSKARGEGSFRHERYYPSPQLSALVEHYWVVEWDLTGQPPELVETLPHPSVHMVFEGGGKSRIGGPATKRFSTVLEGKGRVFAVKFKPAGFQPFAGVSVSKFADRTVPLGEVFGNSGDELDETIIAAATDEARIAAVEDLLSERSFKEDAKVGLVNEIVYSVLAEREILRVDDLVERFGLNKRTLQRLFAKYVGVSPKWVIQRYRLHEAAEILAAGEPASQIDLALDLGYSDQAHFVRDFKAIVGVSPGAYAKNL